jgi:hypothetical protein
MRRTYKWSAVLFCRNESSRISKAIKAIEIAFRGLDAHLTIIANGCSDNTPSIATKVLASTTMEGAVFTIPYGCKSNAINRFIYDLRPNAEYYLFLDGAAFIEPNVPKLFQEAFERDVNLNAVSGLPLNGRTANVMRAQAEVGPRLFGQMFALTAPFLKRLTDLGRRLPIDLYRGDGLLTGYICYETDGISHEIPILERLATVKGAGWKIDPLSLFSLNDVRLFFRRRIRQSRGKLENLAWNSVIWTHGFAALPFNANDMIEQWIVHHNLPKVGLTERFFRHFALRAALCANRPSEGGYELKPQYFGPNNDIKI